jgi:hypothetical protein
MNTELKGTSGTWREIADTARTTINKEDGEGEPSSRWKKQMLLSEHSPIRRLKVSWKWFDIMSFVSTHFVRHKIGIEHFVSTRRTDRTGVDRKKLLQSELINHECEANAQAIITISRKRLCSCADPNTSLAWINFLDVLKETEPELFSVCVPECIYRGFCPEGNCCGYVNTSDYEEQLIKYRSVI